MNEKEEKKGKSFKVHFSEEIMEKMTKEAKERNTSISRIIRDLVYDKYKN